MSVTDVQGRISQIQAQLSLLTPAQTQAGSAAAFAGALSKSSAAAGTGSVGTTAGPSVSGDQVVSEARKYIGTPYVWGGTDPKRGLDCSGLVQLVYKNLGYDVPRVSYEQATAGTAVKGGLVNARPGDILAFGSPVHHVAIYIGNGEMIQAPHTGERVEISKVADFGEPVVAIRRILPDGSGPARLSARVSTTAAMSSSVSAATPYAATFDSAAARTGVPASLLAAVAKQESGFDPTAVSPVGAEGLMQLMPGTAKSLGVTDPMNPTQAINGAADYLRTLINQFGSTQLALAAYNAGPGAVLKYHGVPPYPETQSYVRNVLSSMGAAS